MSFSETIFLFFLALIIFGPKKLPEIARMVGKALNEFRRASNEFKSQIEQEIAHLEVENKQTILPPSTSPEGTTSRTLDAAPSEVGLAEASASSGSSEDEPLFATEKAEAKSATTSADSAGAPPLSDTRELAPSTPQESHV